MGDATPAYLWWPRALERMRDYNPDTRLVVVLRDPIERAFSQWRMQRERSARKVARGVGTLAEDWPVVVEQFLDLPLPAEVTPGGFKGSRSIFSRGLYGEQLARGVGVFADGRTGWCWSSGRCSPTSPPPSTASPTTSACAASTRRRRCATSSPGPSR